MDNSIFKQSDFLAIYTDEENDYFGLGEIIALDNNYLIISSVDPSGLEDGLILYNYESIFKVEKDTKYCKSIMRLRKEINSDNISYEKFRKENILIELLMRAKDKSILVELQLLGNHQNTVFGLVCSINDMFCEITQIDCYGENDGCCVVSTDDITSVKYDSIENRKYYKLVNSI